MYKMKYLIVTLFVALALVGCSSNNNDGNVDDNTNSNAVNDNNNNGNNGNDNMNNDDNDDVTDTHYNYVTGLGFRDVVNPHNGTYNTRYTLNNEYAANDEIFHQWRHTWVEPEDYMDKDIHVYRYTGTLDGEERVIHVMSHNGEVIGGFHHGTDETVEDATMLERNGYTSRLADDFRSTWDDLFGINR